MWPKRSGTRLGVKIGVNIFVGRAQKEPTNNPNCTGLVGRALDRTLAHSIWLPSLSLRSLNLPIHSRKAKKILFRGLDSAGKTTLLHMLKDERLAAADAVPPHRKS